MFRVFLFVGFAFIAHSLELDWLKLNVSRPDSFPREILPTLSTDKNRIIGGHEVEKNSIPYQVALFLHSKEGPTYFCGGILISRKFVLTAAHCAKLAYEITIYLGAHNITENEVTQVRMNSTKFIIHKDYDSQKLINDIALVELPKPITINKEISLVTLPTYSQANETFAKELARVSGWGKVHNSDVGKTDVLRSVESTIETNYDCAQYYIGIIEDSHICMRAEGNKTFCNGDSGGPLIHKGVLIGLVVFGPINCEYEWPGGYTRITKFLGWIEDNSDVIIKP